MSDSIEIDRRLVRYAAALGCDCEQVRESLRTSYAQLIVGLDFSDSDESHPDIDKTASLLAGVVIGDRRVDGQLLHLTQKHPVLGKDPAVQQLYEYFAVDTRWAKLEKPLSVGSWNWRRGVAGMLLGCSWAKYCDSYFDLSQIDQWCDSAEGMDADQRVQLVHDVLRACSAVPSPWPAEF